MLKIGLCEDNEIQHNQILSFLETISLPKHAINSFYKGNDLEFPGKGACSQYGSIGFLQCREQHFHFTFPDR